MENEIENLNPEKDKNSGSSSGTTSSTSMVVSNLFEKPVANSQIKFRNSTGMKNLHKNKLISGNTTESNVFTTDEWNKIIESKSLKYIDFEKLILSIKTGIDERLRGKIWLLLSNSFEIATVHNENIFYKLSQTVDEELDDTINKDIQRTIIYSYNTQSRLMSKIDISKKHKKLFNILKAYAVYDSHVSYCQGTNYIVAVLLLNLNSERACFWSLVQIMNSKKWRDLFTNKTPKLMRMLDLMSNLIKQDIPDLFEYLEEIKFIEYIPAVFTPYFLTLFSYSCPIEYANRVFDLFWLYEEKVIFDCLIYILNLQKEFLMELKFDELFPYLRDKLVIDVIDKVGIIKSLPY